MKVAEKTEDGLNIESIRTRWVCSDSYIARIGYLIAASMAKSSLWTIVARFLHLRLQGLQHRASSLAGLNC